jgi:hypothetical protein
MNTYKNINFKTYKGKFASTRSAYTTYSSEYVSTGSMYDDRLNAIRDRFNKLNDYYDDSPTTNDLCAPYVPMVKVSNTVTKSRIHSTEDADIFCTISNSIDKFINYIKNLNYTEKKNKFIEWIKNDWNKGNK